MKFVIGRALTILSWDDPVTAFFEKVEKLRHSLGRPSRSDFVHFQSYGEIESNRRFEVAHALLIKMNHLSFFILTDNVSTFKMKLNSF